MYVYWWSIIHSHVLLFWHGYGVKTAVTMKCFIDYSPPPKPCHTDCSLFTSIHCSPILSPPFLPLSLSPPWTFLHNQAFLYFYTNPPFSFAIFFSQYGGGSLLLSIPSLAFILYTFWLSSFNSKKGWKITLLLIQ